MNVTACPFCGVGIDVPHESEEACIQALQAEIARVRGFLGQVKDPGCDAAPDPHKDEPEA